MYIKKKRIMFVLFWVPLYSVDVINVKPEITQGQERLKDNFWTMDHIPSTAFTDGPYYKNVFYTPFNRRKMTISAKSDRMVTAMMSDPMRTNYNIDWGTYALYMGHMRAELGTFGNFELFQ